MHQQEKSCQNCQKNFTIEPEDFDFYKRIAVPPPTHCPDCRLQRRLAWRNIFHLYKRPCDLCKKDSLSVYPVSAPCKVYCTECWWSDKWDAVTYGRDYDLSRPFFEQFAELLREVPLMALSYDYPKNVNSPYVNEAGPVKNSSLIFFAEECEEVMVGYYLDHMTNALDTSLGIECQWMYDCRNVFRDNRCIGLDNTIESIDCAFLKDCRNCQSCFGSANLKNKKYVFFDEQLTKEEYEKKIAQYDLGSYEGYQKAKKDTVAHWGKFPPRPIWLDLSVDCTGNYTFESKNCKECYEVQGTEDSAYCHMLLKGPVKNCMDYTGWGNNAELIYESVSVGENSSRLFFCQEAGLNSLNVEYSKLFISSSNLFGCIGVRKKQYCILNKQYSREEYFAKITSIKSQMTKNGEYREYFPISLWPTGYNDSLAQAFFPLTKEEALAKGYKWHEPEKRSYQITMRASELPDHISDATSLVLKNIIECMQCGRGYRVTQMEFDFLKQMRVPLPRRCPFCRIEEKFQQWVKQMKLTNRVCDQCHKDFRTPYTKDQFTSILCKPCWTEKYS